ncbi:hypothetical protein P154DRAFT_430266 [Amniculicola lignicola CBS 123094]|uniref:Uncharacterized protein n=1 Tax=Amniculicola lignicola CBS 123094 TaxID=1392246 RepID=A0A6A5WPX5_9PLEO|nr:hypothetical protein P154DRAFT_430266 [Amniculicola lignicola CBS 123094]
MDDAAGSCAPVSAQQPPAASASASAAQTAAAAHAPKVQQPKPQALLSRSAPSSILVSPRQKGNPILNGVKAVAWEYSDIPADYVLGATTCALFLSLKYHRLHPEYIYNRIRDLKGQYQLRILLTMVDIENHEDSLRELSKTSIVNNVTVMLCWSAQEAGRYVELFKTFENAAPTSIRAQQSSSYSDKLVEFITVPRSINKTDAIGLVSNFGSIRTAVNAGPEEVGLIAGWGEKKVQRWCNAVREPFRIKNAAAKRGVPRENTRTTLSRDVALGEAGDDALFADHPIHTMVAALGVGEHVQAREEMPPPSISKAGRSDADSHPPQRPTKDLLPWAPAEEEEEAMWEAESSSTHKKTQPENRHPGKRKAGDQEDLSDGILAALSKLRQQLPAELQIEIFSYLDHSDLKAVRACSRCCRDNASPKLFERAVACARYLALGAFQKISLHPFYATYVKEIVFDGAIFEASCALKEQIYHMRSVEYPEILCSLTQPCSQSLKRRRWVRYKALYREQEDMRKGGVLLQSIARALDWMTNVTSVVYSPGPHTIPVEAKQVRDLLPRSCPRQGPGAMVQDFPAQIDTCQHGFHHLIGAIYTTQYRNITEFRVDKVASGQKGTEFTLFVFDFPDTSHLEAGRFFFSHLRKLTMNLSLWQPEGAPTFPHSGDYGLKQLSNMAAVFTEATELEEMSFNLTHWRADPRASYGHLLHADRPLFPYLGLTTTWSKLRSLSLGGIYATEEQLQDLVSRHKEILNELSFSTCSLMKGIWASIVENVVYDCPHIMRFTLQNVNETITPVGNLPFASLSHVEQKTWQYCGQLKTDSQGRRTFVSCPEIIRVNTHTLCSV